jgi:hypothetical protein
VGGQPQAIDFSYPVTPQWQREPAEGLPGQRYGKSFFVTLKKELVMTRSGEFAKKRGRVCSNTSRYGIIATGGNRPSVICPPPSTKKNDTGTQITYASN